MSPSTIVHSTLRELRRRLAAGGLRGTLAFLVRGVRAQLVKHELLIVLAKPLDEIAVPARRGTVRLEPVERRHLPALRELNRERGDLDGDARFAADLDAGYGGFAGFHDDELIACYWWADPSMPPHRDMRRLGLGIELGSDDAYGFDLYVHKQHRAGGTANDVLYQVENALHERGFARLWGWVVAENTGARWTYGARGYLPMWEVRRTRVLRRWRNRRAAVAPTAERTPAERKQVAVWTSPPTSSSSSSESS
ncbi:MAG TPA: GNAT family N-acetyltransferase [Conexibacter sp.]|nr:GNAT family N-acetyltransferase [Conexibacter sp.]